MLNSLMKIAWIAVSLCVSATLAVTNYGACTAPSHETGLCVHITDCQHLFNMLFSNSLTDEERTHLRQSQCGYDNTQTELERRVLVCCPDRLCRKRPFAGTKTIRPGDELPGAAECGNVLADRIHLGINTTINEFPWMALIQYRKPNNQYGFHCGGSLINSRYVMTAAHCVKSENKSWEVHAVRLGEWRLDMDPDCQIDVRGNKSCALPVQDIAVERAIVHGNFQPDNRNQQYDIALLRLARSVVFTKSIKPICLPVAEQLRSNSFAGVETEVAGWGLTEENLPSPIKLKTSVFVWEHVKCQAKYNFIMIDVSESLQVCAAGVGGADTCRGDSGGPLMVREKLGNHVVYFAIGIVSIGPKPCAFPNWPGVYTRVGSYMDWIQGNLEP